MSLTITTSENMYYLHGEILQDSLKELKQQLQKMMKTKNRITINIDDVKRIDAFGVQMLGKFMLKAEKNHKDFAIVGEGSRDLYEHVYSDM